MYHPFLSLYNERTFRSDSRRDKTIEFSQDGEKIRSAIPSPLSLLLIANFFEEFELNYRLNEEKFMGKQFHLFLTLDIFVIKPRNFL